MITKVTTFNLFLPSRVYFFGSSILTLWKRDDEPPTRAEEVALSNAVNLFLERIRTDKSIKPSFNTFYEFIRDEYQDILKEKRTREKDFDVWGFLNVLEPYYKGGEYDFLLNSDKQLDLLNHQGQQGTLPDSDHHHYGDLHQQDAKIEGHSQDDTLGGGLESHQQGGHGRVPEVPLQDRA